MTRYFLDPKNRRGRLVPADTMWKGPRKLILGLMEWSPYGCTVALELALRDNPYNWTPQRTTGERTALLPWEV